MFRSRKTWQGKLDGEFVSHPPVLAFLTQKHDRRMCRSTRFMDTLRVVRIAVVVSQRRDTLLVETKARGVIDNLGNAVMWFPPAALDQVAVIYQGEGFRNLGKQGNWQACSLCHLSWTRLLVIKEVSLSEAVQLLNCFRVGARTRRGCINEHSNTIT